MASTDTNTPKLKMSMTRPPAGGHAMRVFQGARTNFSTPTRMTGPAVTKRGIRSSATRAVDGGTPNRVTVGVAKGVRSAPRNARSL